MKTLFSCNLLDTFRGMFYYRNDLFFTHPLFVVHIYYILHTCVYIYIYKCARIITCRALLRLNRGTGVATCVGGSGETTQQKKFNNRPVRDTVLPRSLKYIYIYIHIDLYLVWINCDRLSKQLPSKTNTCANIDHFFPNDLLAQLNGKKYFIV